MHIRRLDPADELEFLERTRAVGTASAVVDPPTTSAAFRELVGRDGQTNERIVVCRNEDGAIVGYFGLGQTSSTGTLQRVPRLLRPPPPSRGRGTCEGSSSSSAMRSAIFGSHRVQASIQPENEPIDRTRPRRGVPQGGDWRSGT